MRRLPQTRAGFTLIEIMLVVVIIGLLMTVAVVNLSHHRETAAIVACQDQIRNFGLALDSYQLDNGFYPTTEQGLQALIAQPTTPPAPSNWRGPYLKPAVIRQDQWGHDYIYKCPGVHDPNGYDLYSVGPDGIDGNNDDIGNWQ